MGPLPMGEAAGPAAAEVLAVEGLTKRFPIHRGLLRRRVGDIRAVDDVTFRVAERETLGIVGESGSGKTTVARCIMRLVEPTSGSIRLTVDGASWDVMGLRRDELKEIKRHIQIVFQDPVSSLDPRMSVGDVIAEGLVLHGMKRRNEREARVAELLGLVGMDPAVMRRYPHEFSGGQRQRIGIARALALGPRVLLCDEPVSALDVSIQAQVLNLFNRLQRELGLSYVFIAHDLTVVQYVSDRIAVMYLGRVVEVAPAGVLSEQPLHPYTEALLAAIPLPDPDQEAQPAVKGDIPDPSSPPSGCHFHTRCPYAVEECRQRQPELRELRANSRHWVACHRADELSLAGFHLSGT